MDRVLGSFTVIEMVLAAAVFLSATRLVADSVRSLFSLDLRRSRIGQWILNLIRRFEVRPVDGPGPVTAEPTQTVPGSKPGGTITVKSDVVERSDLANALLDRLLRDAAVDVVPRRESWWARHGGTTIAAVIAVSGSIGLAVLSRPKDDCLAFMTEMRELRVAFPNSDPDVLFGAGGWEPSSAADGCGDPAAIWAALEP